MTPERKKPKVEIGLIRHVNQIKELVGEDLPTVSLFSVYRPQIEWFNPYTERVHGVSHATRVLVLQELLSRVIIRQGVQLDVEALRWGASVHDVGRENDFIDWNHGTKSAQWAEKNVSGLIADVSMETLKYIVTWHEPYDEEAPQVTPELAILKDADGLDRERVGYAYINPKMLRHNVSRTTLLGVARGLLLETEKNGGKAKDQFESVMLAGVKLGIILEK